MANGIRDLPVRGDRTYLDPIARARAAMPQFGDVSPEELRRLLYRFPAAQRGIMDLEEPYPHSVAGGMSSKYWQSGNPLDQPVNTAFASPMAAMTNPVVGQAPEGEGIGSYMDAQNAFPIPGDTAQAPEGFWDRVGKMTEHPDFGDTLIRLGSTLMQGQRGGFQGSMADLGAAVGAAQTYADTASAKRAGAALAQRELALKKYATDVKLATDLAKAEGKVKSKYIEIVGGMLGTNSELGYEILKDKTPEEKGAVIARMALSMQETLEEAYSSGNAHKRKGPEILNRENYVRQKSE
jgi:hypothetical protein